MLIHSIVAGRFPKEACSGLDWHEASYTPPQWEICSELSKLFLTKKMT
jgi:hypothetical protein